MKNVQFARGSRKSYDNFSAEEKARKIYFSQDTNEIIVNNIVYGVNVQALEMDAITSVTMPSPGLFIFQKITGTTIEIEIPTATTEYNGLLSKEDKAILDSLSENYVTKDEYNKTFSWEEV